MKSIPLKNLLSGLCGLLVVSLIAVAGAPALAGNAALSDQKSAVSGPVQGVDEKVVADYAPQPAFSDKGLSADIGSEFEKLKISPICRYFRLQPGHEENFSVSVENRDNRTINLKPGTLIIPYTENFADKSWIEISPSKEKTLKPGDKAEFQVKVKVPAEADPGNYAVLLAFTNKVPEGDISGYYPNFPGTMRLDFDVYIPPSVQVLTPYINDRVEAGKTYNYEIALKNTGKEDIVLNPEIVDDSYNIVMSGSASSYGEMAQAFGSEALSLDAPKKIAAGQTAVVKLQLKVPDGVKGSYIGSIDLKINDPGIRDYEGRVPLNFRVLSNPDKPYSASFKVASEGPVTITLKASQYGYDLYPGSGRALTPSFKLSLKDPSGRSIEPALTGTEYSGSVNFESVPLPPLPPVRISGAGSDESYRQGASAYAETYTVPGIPGEWTLSVLPKNMENFEYTITSGPASK